MEETIKILSRKILSRGFGRLEEITFRRRRFDGQVQELKREFYDTGNAAAILLYDRARHCVLLVRQFRMASYLADGTRSMIEVCAGKLEGEAADRRIVMEVMEETGFAIKEPRYLFDAYMSPASFGERMSFFVAPYSAADRIGPGGGLAESGEDIEILEPSLEEALAMIDSGEIVDAKTIILLQYARAVGLMS